MGKGKVEGEGAGAGEGTPFVRRYSMALGKTSVPDKTEKRHGSITEELIIHFKLGTFT